MRITWHGSLNRWIGIALLAVLALGQWWFQDGRPPSPDPDVPAAQQPATRVYPDFLPAQAHAVIERILRGAAHPYRRDGSVFQNRERRLPIRSVGHYREYTVPTPGARDRGARRIVTGGDPPTEFWYSDDHYRSFRSFEVPR